MTIKLVIFDFDGTLADSIPLIVHAFQRTCRTMGHPVPTTDEVRAAFGPCEEGIFQRLMPDRWHEAMRAFLREYEQAHVQLLPTPFDGVRDMLAGLRERGVATALVTGKGPSTAAVSLARLDLLDEFDHLRTGSPEGDIKHELIPEVAREAGLAPAQCAYVGDAGGDMRAARQSGALAVGAAWSPTARPEELRAAGADIVFSRFEDFVHWLDAAVTRAQG